MNDFVNSFSAFGEKRNAYMTLFPLIIRMHYSLYPDKKWKIRITTDRSFCGSDFYGNTINKLAERGLLQLRVVTNGGSMWEQSVKGVGMLWRLLPVWDKENTYVFCRDLDSILTPRQAKFVQNFINSNYIIHGINDNDQHNIPLMGGMIGVKCLDFINICKFSKFSYMIDRWGIDRDSWNHHGKDQDFLMKYIWPILKSNALINKVEGPNNRSMMKDCVPGIKLIGVSKKIIDEGDNFTNYIGASNCNNTTYGEKAFNDILSFYEINGNKEMIEKIIEAEKA